MSEPITYDQARKWRKNIEKASASLPDKEASEIAWAFPRMKYNGELIPYQTRINWCGTVKQAAVDLWDTPENDPEHAPALWLDISYKDGVRYIKENMSAGEAFALGERGWWEGRLYESLVAANVYTPASYPAGWRLVNNE